MKFKVLYIAIITFTLTLFSSCDKLPMNGDLDGQWQVMTIERGSITEDIKTTQLYWSFQLHLVQLSNRDSSLVFYAHFRHSDGRISLSDIAFNSKNETAADDNTPMTQEDINANLLPWGITTVDDSFEVEHLTSSAMVLKNGNVRITFRKF